MLLLHCHEAEAECTNQTSCRNEYNEASKKFYRTHWNLIVVPDDIPAEAKEVYLHNNRITLLPHRVFSHLTRCVILHLENNRIYLIEQGAFDFMRKLQVLILVRNNITSVGPVWRGLNNLKWLYIQWNQISQIQDGSFRSLNFLERLVLDQNEIKHIGARTFQGVVNLKVLFLHHNQISIIQDGAFADLRKLEVLYLWENKIQRISQGVWSNLNRLRELHIFQNHISHIEEGVFDSLSSLEKLYLGNNNISNTIWVSRNLQNLRLLGLESNKISYIQQGTFNLSSLGTILLHNNNLATLSPDLFINLPRPLDLTLSSGRGTNRWNCRSLCWAKHEQAQGTLNLHYNRINYQPKCATGGDWRSLQCGNSGQSLVLDSERHH